MLQKAQKWHSSTDVPAGQRNHAGYLGQQSFLGDHRGVDLLCQAALGAGTDDIKLPVQQGGFVKQLVAGSGSTTACPLKVQPNEFSQVSNKPETFDRDCL